MVRVSDARQALAQISATFFGFPQRDVTIIGVTGTKGKTTVAGDGLLCHEPHGPGLRRHRLQRGRLRREARGNQQYHTGELRADAAVSGHAGRGRPVCGDGGVLSGAGPPPGGRITFDTAVFTNLSRTTSAPRSIRTMPTTGQQEAAVRLVPPRHLQRRRPGGGV